MHVLLIPSWYPANVDDINGSFFREQAIALAKEGAQVGVIAPIMKSLRTPSNILSISLATSYENDFGVHTYRRPAINIFPRMPTLTGWRWKRLGLSLYKRYVKERGKPDIIHVHSMINAGMVAREIKGKYAVPYVVTEHSSLFARNMLSAQQLEMARDISKEANLRFAVSSTFCELLSKQLGGGEEEWCVLPNIVEKYFFELSEKQIKVNNVNKKFTFLGVCFLTKNKRVDILLRAFAKAYGGLSKIRLKIGGDGPEQGALIRLADSLGISAQVEFLGMLSREEVADEMMKSDVFVLSSQYETFGVVVAEALALGKPVVATRCGGPEDIVRKQDGILVPINDVESLSNAMIDIKKNIGQYNSKTISAGCAERFSERVIARKTLNIYKKILARDLTESSVS